MSLLTCLQKAGEFLDAEDKSAILRRSRELRGAGTSVDDAAKQAVSERMQFIADSIAAGKTPALETAEAYAARREAQRGQVKASVEQARERVGRSLAEWEQANPQPRVAGLEEAADKFGFGSVDEMLRAIAEKPQRDDLIRAMTDQRMLQEHGELLDPKAVELAANAAVHNESRQRFVAAGLKVLTKSKLPARQIAAAAKQAAEAVIAAKKVSELKPGRYAAAEARAHKEALKLLAKDPAGAAEAQRQALLNNSLERAAIQAIEDAKKTVEYFKRLEGKAAQGNMRGESLEQINELLARFDLRTSVKNARKDTKPLPEWLDEESDRLSAVMPDLPQWILDDGVRAHYSELTVEQLRGLRDAVKQLEVLARREQKQYLAIRNMEFAEERDAILAEMRATWADAFDADGVPKGLEAEAVPTLRRAISRLGDKFAGEFLSPENLISILGGGKFGVISESLFGRLSSRSDWKANRLAGIYKQLQPLFDQYSPIEKAQFGRKDIATAAGLKVSVPGKIKQGLTRENALVVALLYGNKEGRERLANYGWDDAKQKAIVDLLDERDMKLANAIWRLFDKDLWPELDALNKRTKGSSPPKVEAIPFSARGGEATGGYFHLQYDPRLSERAGRFKDADAAKALLGGSSLGMSAKTRQGTSIERKEGVKHRPSLTLDVFAETVNETVHDIAYREAVADTMRMLNDESVIAVTKQVIGHEGYRALVNRVREVAAPPVNPMGFLERTISIARRNTVVNLMSGVKTALQNFTGLVPALTEVNAGTMAAEIARFYSPAMTERYRFAVEHSEFMRNRFDTYERDLQNSIKRLTVNGGMRPDTSTFLALMGFVDRGVSVPVWNAAFKQGMERFAHDVDRAVAYADSVVRTTQGSGRDVDLAQVMGGHGGWGELKRAFTMFYSYFNSQLGLLVKAGVVSKIEARQNPALAAAKFAARFMAIVVVPTVLTELLMRGLVIEGEDEEQTQRRWAGAFVKYGAGMIPFVRDIVPGIWAVTTGDKYYGTKVTPVASAFEGVVKASKSVADFAAGEGDERDLRNLIMGVGFATGTPGKLVADTIDGTRAWLEGEAGPQAIVLGPPPKP